MGDSTQCPLVIFFTCKKAIQEADWTYRLFHRVKYKEIEITSWKARAYGIFTRVGEVSEIERVSAANE